MCGIIGYIGNRQTVPILISGLHKLEYRGYDSAGICILGENLKTIKRKGQILELEKEKKLNKLKGVAGIAHTRWATHGEPNRKNAHPHLDCNREIAIVHNGIIENYQTLKKLLEKEGHTIKSNTDSEVIAHLIEKFYKNDLEKAVVKTLSLLKGTFGLAVIHKNENKIIGARRGSPLIVGVGKREFFITSDVSAILAHTKKAIYLNDNELVIIEPGGYKIKHLVEKKILNSKIHNIDWSFEQIEKKGFKHFMLKEIFEQPTTIENVIRGRVINGRIKERVDLNLNSINKITIVACGTSWHSALIGKHLIEKIAKTPVEVDYASEFRYRNPIIDNNNAVLAISQSGETADTLAALKEAKKKKAKTIGVVNVVGSSIAREVDVGMYLRAGPEIGVASTKAFTSQIASLLILALLLRQKSGNLDKDLLREFKQLPKKVNLVLNQSKKIRQLARKFKDNDNFLYLGRKINFPVALEGALKLKEISYIHAEGYPAAEMKHGPIALIDKNMPVVFLAPKDNAYEKILSNMEEIKARKGKIIAVTDSMDKKITRLTKNIIKVPKTREELAPIINVIPLQLLAYHIADLKKINVDKPRNLAKSVTVE